MTALKYWDPGTATWKTIGVVQGPQGPAGPIGPVGTVYDTDQIGVVKAYAGAVIPTNWMLADGRSLLRADYPQLFTAFGGVASPYGLPDGTHFNLPDLTHRFIYGAQAAEALNGKGGETAHVLKSNEGAVATHGHANSFGVNNGPVTSGTYPWMPIGDSSFSGRGGGSGSGPLVTSGNLISYSAGSHGHTMFGGVTNHAGADAANAHENMPPWILLAQIIKVTGVSVDSGGALIGATGPQGATGLQGATGAQGPTGPTGPGGLLDIRRQISSGNQYVAHISGQQLYIDAAKTIALTLGYVPPVNCWWEVHAHIGLVQKVDAAYHYMQPQLQLNVPDADGFQGIGDTRTQHSQVNTYEPYDLQGLFKLAAGVNYFVTVPTGMSGGSWQYFQSSNNLFIEAKAWAR